MRKARWTVVALGAVFLTACSEDIVSALVAKIVVTAHEPQNYADFDDTEHYINLGSVPVFATKRAVFQIENPSGQNLEVQDVVYESSTGKRWDVPGVDPAPGAAFDETEELDFRVGPYGKALLIIPYSPREEGAHELVAVIQSNAGNAGSAGSAGEVRLRVEASADFNGAPDIEVEYNGYRGPAPSDCVDVDTDGVIDGCAISAADALDFGNIGLGSRGTTRLILHNTAACDTPDGVDACTICSLTVEQGTRQIGLGFKPGTNDQGLFAFEGSTATPFDLPQRNVECGNTGEVRLLIGFQAPTTEGEFSTTVVVESSDPDEPVIEIPVRARARNAPVAVAKFREYDPLAPSAPFTDPADIEPLTKVYFDGRDSFDPRDPTDPSLIGAWEWNVVEYPSGLDRNAFAMNGQTNNLFDFWLPLAGHYVVQLTVWNTDGIKSGDTPGSRVEFDVVPGSRLHVQLTWDDAANDQDLHLMYLAQTTTLCVEPWDCYFGNRTPAWFTATGADDPNPRLDIDDVFGLGPENINIDDPQPGTYRVAVHYWRDDSVTPTRNTVRLFLNGVQVGEYRRLLQEQQQWLVADITWMADGTAYATPYPSDAAGEVGAVSSWPRSSCSNGL